MNDATGTSALMSTTINAGDNDAVRAWAEKLDVTSAQIREGVSAVGPQATDVELHLKGSRSTTNADQEDRAERGPIG